MSLDGAGAATLERYSQRAMGTRVTVSLPPRDGGPRPGETAIDLSRQAVSEAFAVFAALEESCSRFDPKSPLMVANATPRRFHPVPLSCFRAIEAAHAAYHLTAGRFDPRIWADLVALGYDRSFEAIAGGPATRSGDDGTGPAVRSAPTRRCRPRRPLGPWRPRLRPASHEVQLGRHGIDLGGIGKGLAVGWASRVLGRRGVRDHLVEAGGDCYCAGRPPDGTGWLVGVEDPTDPSEPLAVLSVSDRACATSSVTLRAWRSGGRAVHHLVDPRTGLPGGDGLLSVTVVHLDPARAEVWSKSLLLEGAEGISRLAERKGLAALYVREDGSVGCSRAMGRYLSWRRRGG